MKLKHFGLILILMVCGCYTNAQTWMNGFSYRKKITINKSKVVAKTIVYTPSNIVDYDLVDFPVLIDLTDNDLIYYPGTCGNKIQDANGRDISFALSTAPATPLNFQVERYEPTSGRLVCWVKISSLAANKTATTATSIYLYYGSSSSGNLHNPYGSAALGAWNNDYTKVVHLNELNQATGLQNLSSAGASSEQAFKPAKVGDGIDLNEGSNAFNAGLEESTTVSISTWIKPAAVGRDQVIMTNDSLGRGGYQLKLNSANKLVFDVFRGASAPGGITGGLTALSAGTWYHVYALFSGTVATIYLNGTAVGSGSVSTFRLGAGGTLKIGRSRLGTNKFYGMIDEIRVQKINTGTEWITTEYNNQNDPASFYTIAAEEYNPSGFYRFTGSGNQWNLASNWSTASIPGANANVVIAAGKSARYSGTGSNQLNKLIVEQGGSLTLSSDLQFGCISQVAAGGKVMLTNGATLTFSSNLLNNGLIASDDSGGTVKFAGSQELQEYGGIGTLKIPSLKVDQLLAQSNLLLNSTVQVTGFVDVKKGILNANGNLKLLATSATNTAAVLPIADPSSASIIGQVTVEQFISGSYPSPATARGWRLLSSPVYTGISGGNKEFDLLALKNVIFITGNGGLLNGFDPSPLNGGTIYTHDQSLPGTLSQKYIPIKNTNDKIPLGKGIYVFSRGNKTIENAYAQQIEHAPFSNPASYTIQHRGQLFTGNLIVSLSNRKTGAEGDGFNLVGNPYASPLRWGSITKSGVLPFIWQFDPLNNAYIVSDAPETIIPLGSAFFVKVVTTDAQGLLTFTENAKYTSAIPALPYLMSGKSTAANGLPDIVFRLKISKEDFSQSYVLKLKDGGRDEVTDEDALKLGEGIVNIGGIAGNAKLAIDERSLPIALKNIDIYVKVSATGNYKLSIDGINSNLIRAFLVDHYLGIQREIGTDTLLYDFLADKNIPTTEGDSRFKLLVKPKEADSENKMEIAVFPNPFHDQLKLRTTVESGMACYLEIKNVIGNTVLRQGLRGSMEVNTNNLPVGMYLLQLISSEGKKIKTIKILKN
ncbi:DUF2341 domain-containing protein [Pedobacter sp. PWIIR3]